MKIFKTPPLVVTLKIDADSQQYFSALRKIHFPPHANYLDAHLTLFHNLPVNEKIVHDELLRKVAGNSFQMQVNEIKNMGTGVAFSIVSKELQALHRELQQAFDKYLIMQDRQPLWPHITIQNKVTAHKAQKLQEEINDKFKPFSITAIGFSTWLYMKGPWMHQEEFLFSKNK